MLNLKNHLNNDKMKTEIKLPSHLCWYWNSIQLRNNIPDDHEAEESISMTEFLLSEEEFFFSLFDGRHDMPKDSFGAVFSGYDFDNKNGERTDLYEWALSAKRCKLYATGLTPALLEFIREFMIRNLIVDCDDRYNYSARHNRSLSIMHYDKATDSYWEQKIC